MGTSRNKDRQFTSRSVLMSFTVHYLGWEFIPQWNSTNAECVLVTVGITSLFVELIGVAA